MMSGEFDDLDSYLKTVEREFDRASDYIETMIDKFYNRYAKNNNMTLQEAHSIMPTEELKKLKRELKNIPKNSLSDAVIKKLDNFYSLNKITVLRAQHTQLLVYVDSTYNKMQSDVTDRLKQGFEDTYYQTIFAIQQEFGYLTSFSVLNRRTLDMVMKRPWKYGYFSKNWENSKGDLIQELTDALSSAFYGTNRDVVIDTFRKRMDVSKYRARRIIHTEHSFITNEARFEAYGETGIKKYQYVATLDTRTSEVCKKLDREVIPLKYKEVGVNFPPLHCFCRSTTIPYLKGINENMLRIARDSNGKNIRVPATMTYAEWHKKYIKKD